MAKASRLDSACVKSSAKTESINENRDDERFSIDARKETIQAEACPLISVLSKPQRASESRRVSQGDILPSHKRVKNSSINYSGCNQV